MPMVCIERNLKFSVIRRRCGFTLIEVLVVIAIISLLMSIIAPTFISVRRRARTILSMNNQKDVILALTFFASDNKEKYPQSVATIGMGNDWHWQDPRMVIGYLKRTPRTHRAVSEYLSSYIDDADKIVCPLAPVKYRYLQQAWKAGDTWDNPETIPNPDPLIGSYCFYWNYVGYRVGGKTPFIGPRSPAGYSRAESKLLMSCYLGYNHWRSPSAIGSCEKLFRSKIVPETFIASAYWAVTNADLKTMPQAKLIAGYTDGHVESFLPSDTVPMKVAITTDGSIPYPDDVGPGVFFLPANAVQ